MIGFLTYSIMELRKHCKIDHYSVTTSSYPQLFEDMKTLPPFSARWLMGEGKTPILDSKNQALADHLVATWGYAEAEARASNVYYLIRDIAKD